MNSMGQTHSCLHANCVLTVLIDGAAICHCMEPQRRIRVSMLQELMRRVATWLKPGGLLFVHIFVENALPYHFIVRPSHWLSSMTGRTWTCPVSHASVSSAEIDSRGVQFGTRLNRGLHQGDGLSEGWTQGWESMRL